MSRPGTTEVTALGAAFLAGLAEGFWGSLEEVRSLLPIESELEPVASENKANRDHTEWLAAVERAAHWEHRPPTA